MEQWEVDLRKHLEERVNSGKSWEEELKEDIDDVELPPKRKPQPKQPKKQESNNRVLYYFVIFILLIANLYLYDKKSDGRISNWLKDRIRSGEVAQNDPVRPGPSLPPPGPGVDVASELKFLRAEIVRLETQQKQQKEEWDKLAAKVKWNSDRIALIGAVLNENYLILRNGYPTSHMIFFNHDWTIDRYPQYLQISEEDREFLKKYVRPGS